THRSRAAWPSSAAPEARSRNRPTVSRFGAKHRSSRPRRRTLPEVLGASYPLLAISIERFLVHFEAKPRAIQQGGESLVGGLFIAGGEFGAHRRIAIRGRHRHFLNERIRQCSGQMNAGDRADRSAAVIRSNSYIMRFSDRRHALDLSETIQAEAWPQDIHRVVSEQVLEYADVANLAADADGHDALIGDLRQAVGCENARRFVEPHEVHFFESS